LGQVLNEGYVRLDRRCHNFAEARNRQDALGPVNSSLLARAIRCLNLYVSHWLGGNWITNVFNDETEFDSCWYECIESII
jgi:hypothetical protein